MQIINFILELLNSNKSQEKQDVKIEQEPKMDSKPYLITEAEILKNCKKEDIPTDHQKNLEVLLERINKVRYAWNKPMRVTSGYRSMDDHIRIYKALAAQRGVPYDESKVPMASKHLSCAAVDISDPDGKLYKWVQDNIPLMEEIELWMEEKDDQARVHFQIYPPKSGKRFFKP